MLFPKIVNYKHRNNKKTRRTRQEIEILKGRKYSDFIEYISKNPNSTIVEMDTVEVFQDEPYCFLTLIRRKSNFILIFKLESQTKEQVILIMNNINGLYIKSLNNTSPYEAMLFLIRKIKLLLHRTR